MMRHCRRSERGFSMSELLVVVAILGLIALISVPALMQLMPQYRIRSAASELAAGMRFIRQKAMTTRIPWKVQLDATGERYAYARFTGTQVTDATLATTANWQYYGRDARTTPASESYWTRFSAIDLRTDSTNPFKDVNCDGYREVIFLRDGSISTAPNGAGCGGGAALTFTTQPTVVVAVNNSFVRYNRYRLGFTANGALTITAAKE
ncbi:MAG TPA: prepilin-type N-terminal cleavage/methylation domain-containing protein [Thermoanaerobaculia bacterium]|nr:prepilin-type N-terminal cleavage/methylation domain-containing protein [Thermoanaerobaculia bacterium]